MLISHKMICYFCNGSFSSEELEIFKGYSLCSNCLTEENKEKIRTLRKEEKRKRSEYINRPEYKKTQRKLKYRLRLRQWERIRKIRKEWGYNAVFYGKLNPKKKRL